MDPLQGTTYGSSSTDLEAKTLHHLMLVNVNYCQSTEAIRQSLESGMILKMTLIRSLSRLDCPPLDGTIFVKEPGANVLNLPLDDCRTLIETWADFEQKK